MQYFVICENGIFSEQKMKKKKTLKFAHNLSDSIAKFANFLPIPLSSFLSFLFLSNISF